MSVSSILTSLETQVASTLGASWSELEYIYNLEANTISNSDFRYGIGSTTGQSVSGVNKALTLDFGFFVVLTKNFVNRSSDEKQRAILSSMYDSFEDINKNVFQKKLSNANILLVSELSYSEPQVVNDATLALRVDFTIKYRNQTT